MTKLLTPEQFLEGILSRKDKPKLNLTDFIELFEFVCAMYDGEDPYVKPAMSRYAKCQKYLMNQSKSNNISFIMTCLILTNHNLSWQKTKYLYKEVEEDGTTYDALPHRSIDTICAYCPVEIMDSCRIEMYDRMMLIRNSDNKFIPYDEYPDNHKIIAMLATTHHIVQIDGSPDLLTDTELCYIASVVNPCIFIFCDQHAKKITVRRITGKKFITNACRATTQEYPYSKFGVLRSILDIIAGHPTFNEYSDKDLERYVACL